MKTRIAALLFAVFLAACGGDEQTVDFNWERASLTYSYPANGQAAVPLHAPMVLRFSDALTTTDPLAPLSLETAAGDPVSFSATLTADGRAVVLTPDAPLAPATDYVLDAGDQDTDVGSASFPENGVRFTTRIEPDGPAAGARTDTVFRVERMIPDGNDMPLMDFSSLRLQFSQPIDRATLEYGTTVALQGGGGLVEANVIASGPYLTIDPVNDMTSGASYQLQLGTGLQSTLGNSLVPGDYADREIVPEDSGVGATLVQKAGVSNETVADQCGPDTGGDRLSPLTGEPINCVPIESLLLGDKTSSQQEGDVYAELASLNRYPHMTPLRIPRGSLLKGASVEVNVAGEVPVRFASGDASTGEISVRFISDANGYMFRNPYTDDAEAPRHIRLFMDVAMNTANTEANASLSQDLMHLELVGTAIIIDGRMTIDAVGVVEPEVLGLETAYGTLSFHMESYRDQLNAPTPAVDDVNPVVQSWAPGDHADKHRPGDPLIVNFSEPLDRTSLQGNIDLQKNGVAEPFDWHLDGATLVIHPQSPLAYGADYDIYFTQSITDLAGNTLVESASQHLAFTMPSFAAGDRAPLVTTTYPGFPCVTTDRNLAANDHGRCSEGQGSDDHLPVTTLPAERPIVVQFSQDMLADSIALGGSFLVERDNGAGGWEPVAGRLDVRPRLVRFHPETPWEAGTLYRYTLGSNGDENSSAATCDGTDAICSQLPGGATGYPLQTRMLAQNRGNAPAPTGGGPDMTIYFRGGGGDPGVFQRMTNLPTADVNADLVHQDSELQPTPDGGGGYLVPDNGTELRVENTSGLILKANVGCGFDGGGYNPPKLSCEGEKFLHLTGALNADVVGYDAGRDAVKVHVYPTQIYTSSVDVYAVLLLVVIPEIKNVPTGPQIMRIRYADNGSGQRTEPVTGWIEQTAQGPVFTTELDMYLDAPYLRPDALGIELPHNQHSYELNDVKLSGAVTFLPDGRMQIEQLNVDPDGAGPENGSIPINVSIGGGVAGMNMAIPEKGIRIRYLSSTIKE